MGEEKNGVSRQEKPPFFVQGSVGAVYGRGKLNDGDGEKIVLIHYIREGRRAKKSQEQINKKSGGCSVHLFTDNPSRTGRGAVSSLFMAELRLLCQE